MWKDLITGVSRIIHEDDEYFPCDITECCKVGPIVRENYCPKCGKRLIREL